MKVVLLRNILINGQHAEALTEHDLDDSTALQLIRQRLAALPKPTGASRARKARVVETAFAPAPEALETAALAATPPPASTPAA